MKNNSFLLILVCFLFEQDTTNTPDGKLDTSDEIERVQMMTIHGAKGLEFHYVFIAGLGKSLSFIDLSLLHRQL